MKTVVIGPYTLFADENSRPGLDILQNGWNYEVHVRKELERFVPECSAFLDIGANVGCHSMIAKVIRKDVPVFSVEMSHVNISFMLQSIVFNKLSDWVVIPVAVASAPTIIRSNNDTANTSCSGPESDQQAYPNLTPALPIDFYNLPAVDLVKIDIEGFEMAAWRGMINTLKSVKHMIFEFAPSLVFRSGTTPEAQLQWIIDRGFKLTMLDYVPGLRRDFTNPGEVLTYMTEKNLWIVDMLANR